MTVKELLLLDGFGAVTVPTPERMIEGVYAADLLSWVMGRAKADNAWLTIMSNINVVAVATLTDVSCVILTEGVALDKEIVATAEEKGVNILSTTLTTYEAAALLSRVLP